jgi:hypothetical protein
MQRATPSNFGRTSERDSDDLLAPRRAGFPKPLLFGAPLVLVLVGFVLFIRARLSDNQGADAATSAAPQNAAAQSAVPVQKLAEPVKELEAEPVKEPEPLPESFPLPPPETPEVHLTPAQMARGLAPARPLSARPAVRPRAGGARVPDASPPASPVPPVKVEEPHATPPPPKPASRAESDRDFGY